MYKHLLYSLILFIPFCLIGQDTVQCIEIDFEQIPGESFLFEGLPINEQYREAFGIFFELENGGIPVLAQVGPPTTAFGGMFGGDNPAPGVNLGQFFLTDDGVLTGLTSPPIIINFDVPVDTFSGCIMDMDFDEQFIIHARDINGEILLADTIRAGDPMTGDGQQTCWGFNLDDCQGTIFSIRYEGSRNTPGAFGLGLDNLTFCTGVDVNTQITTTITETACGEFEAGSILIQNTGPGVFQYSIDGSPLQDDPFFGGLTAGEHNIILVSDAGCTEVVPVFIDGPTAINFIDLNANDTSCDLDNGSLNVETSLTEGVQFSINGVDFQESPVFDSLGPGDYTVYALDAFGCMFEESISIGNSTSPNILEAFANPDNCGDGVGVVSVMVEEGSAGPVLYSIDDGENQESPQFSNLFGGSYNIRIVDSDGCQDSILVEVDSTARIRDVSFNINHPICDPELPNLANGAIEVAAVGGTGQFNYTLNNEGNPQTSNIFDQLIPGIYDITIVDEFGCIANASVSLDEPRCPVWIPNVFSPNKDAINDYFNIATINNYNLGINRYIIFDRWGNKVFKSENFAVEEADKYWDGIYQNQAVEVGVYTYLIEVLHPNGEIEFFAGDVTLVR